MTYAVYDGTFLERPSTGIGRVTRELVKASARQVGPGRPIDRMAVATFSGAVPPGLGLEGLETIRLGLGHRTALLGYVLPGAYNLAKRIQPPPDVICWQIPERFTGDIKGARQAVIVHDLSIIRYPQNHSLMTRFLCNAALKRLRKSTSRVIAISEATRRELIKLAGIEPERITPVLWAAGSEFGVVDDRTRLNDATRRLGVAGKRFLLFVGQPSPRKNVPMLMRVFLKTLRARREPLGLVIVGARHEDMDKLCAELGYTDAERKAVIVTGVVTDADLVALYNLAHALVFPTLYEGFGLTVAEAMACGLPVISSNATSIPEVAADAGLLLDPAAEEAWTDAIGRVLDEPALHADLRRRGLERARQLTWDRAAEQVLSVLAQA